MNLCRADISQTQQVKYWHWSLLEYPIFKHIFALLFDTLTPSFLTTTGLPFQGTQQEWQYVFFICGAVYAIGCVVYLIFGSGQEQEWAKVGTSADSNMLMIDVKKGDLLTEKC